MNAQLAQLETPMFQRAEGDLWWSTRDAENLSKTASHFPRGGCIKWQGPPIGRPEIFFSSNGQGRPKFCATSTGIA